jgi:flagellar biosynthesis chaperone FliJ
LEKVEEGSLGGSSGVFRDVIDIVRMNQQLVDELAKSNDALRLELSKLPGKLEELIMEMREIITFIKSSGEEDAVGVTKEAMQPVVDKLTELIEQNKKTAEKNDTLLEVLEEVNRRTKRRVAPPSSMLLQKKPPARPIPGKM